MNAGVSLESGHKRDMEKGSIFDPKQAGTSLG